MKSAYELAMERFDQEATSYSDEQKQELAEIDKVHDAKVAEARLAADGRLAANLDPEAQDEVRAELSRKLSSIESQREAAKDKIRNDN